MADPEKKEEGQPDTPPTEGASSEVVQQLGLDKLEDQATQSEVASYFEKKAKLTELTHEKQKNLRALLEKDMEKFNTTRAGSAEIIQSVVQKILEDARERDLNEVFYPDFKKLILETEKVDMDDDWPDDENHPIFKKAWGMVADLIKRIPVTVKREYVKSYADEIMQQFAKDMENEAETLAIGQFDMNDFNDMKKEGKFPRAFDEWMKDPGRPGANELMIAINPGEAKAYVEGVAKVKSSLDEFRNSITGVPNALAEYFTKEAKAIEGFMTDNPNRAMTAIAAAMTAITAASALEDLKTGSGDALKEVETLKAQNPNLDATLETGYKGLQEKVDKSYQDYLTTKDAKKLDVAALQREKSALDAKLAEAKKAPAAAQPAEQPPAGTEAGAAGTEVPNPAKDPEGFFKKMAEEHPIVFGILSMLGMDKLFQKFFKKKEGTEAETGGTETAAAGGAAAGSADESKEKQGEKDARKAKEDAEKLAKAEKRLKDRFHLTEDEMKVLTPLKVPDFIKLADPPRGVDKTRFESLKKAFQKNGGNEKTEETVLEYYMKQENEWKAE